MTNHIIEISIDDLSDGGITKLLQAHREEMHKYSPVDSLHALDTHQLDNPNLTFWGARINGELVGCGAIHKFAPGYGEIKSMKTDMAHLRKGIAAKILMEIIAQARQRNYSALFLETGSHDAFLPAITLYEKHGFVECGPFADYKLDPHSRFFTKNLN